MAPAGIGPRPAAGVPGGTVFSLFVLPVVYSLVAGRHRASPTPEAGSGGEA